MHLIEQNKIYAWGDTRRFNSYAHYFKQQFGTRLQKVTLDAGFTCPNRDGTVGKGGCTYCDNRSFNPSYCKPQKTVSQQIEEGITFHANRYRRTDQFLAYFQAYSNTYAPLDHLKRLYEEALSHPKVVGIVVGTRPDCVDEHKLDYLAQLAQKYYVAVEYGVESCYNRTLNRINRCHDFECSKNAIQQTADRGIATGAHLMFGLPGESVADMLDEIDIISELPLTTIKFHQLQLIKNTRMTQEYFKQPTDFHQFTVEEYIRFIAQVVSKLRPNLVVERIVGEVPPSYLAVPSWCLLRNDQLLAKFEQYLEQEDLWQGKTYQHKTNTIQQ